MGTAHDNTTYAQSIASDIYAMIATSREEGLNLTTGFQNQAFSSPTMAIRYLFFPKEELMAMAHFPKDLQQQFKKSNIMSIIEHDGKAISINLLCALDKGFADVESAEEIEKHLRPKDVEKFGAALKKVLAQDFKTAADELTKKDNA